VRKPGEGGGYFCEAISDGSAVPADEVAPQPDGGAGGLLLLGVVLIVVLVGVRRSIPLPCGVLLLLDCLLSERQLRDAHGLRTLFTISSADRLSALLQLAAAYSFWQKRRKRHGQAVREMEKHAADLAAMGAISDLSLAHAVDDKANRENADLDKRYGTGGGEYEDVVPALPPVSKVSQDIALLNAGASAGGWRASVAMYRAERDARARSGSSGDPGLPSRAPPVPPVGAGTNAKTTRPAVLQGTAGLSQAERRQRIEDNLAASVDPSQLLYVSADGTLC
jgi:hypothetical protein